MGLFQMRIAGEDKVGDTECLIFTDAFCYLLRIANQRRSGPAAHQPHARPQIRGNTQIVARSFMQRTHSRLAGRVHTGKNFLRLGDSLVVKMRNQPIGGGPRLFFGFADNHVQTNPVLQRTAPGGGALAHHSQLFGHQRRRLAPGQVGINLIGGDVDGLLGRSAKVERRAVFLHRWKQHFSAFHVDMLTAIVHLFTLQQARVDVEKFAGHLIAFAVAEENAVAFVLHRIATGNDVNQQPAARQAIERRRHSRRQRWRLQARANGHQIAQAAGQRRQGRCHQP